MTRSSLDFSSLVGFEKDFLHLTHLIGKKKLPPIILFHGREAIGKNLFVAKLCSYLVCESKTSCGHCEMCLSFIQNKNPSVLFLDNDNDLIQVSSVSLIKEHLLTCAGGFNSSRIVYIRDAERLSQQSTNKLLTIFEELPSSTYVFLTTGRRYTLLATLRSRCVQYSLNPPSLKESFEHIRNKYLLDHSQESSNKLTSQEALDLLKQMRGSLGYVIHFLNEKKSLYLDLIKVFFDKTFIDNYENVYELIELLKKDKNYSTEDFIVSKEIALNKAYKEVAFKNNDSFDLSVLAKKRQALQILRKSIMDKKIKLNKAFVLENLLIV